MGVNVSRNQKILIQYRSTMQKMVVLLVVPMREKKWGRASDLICCYLVVGGGVDCGAR